MARFFKTPLIAVAGLALIACVFAPHLWVFAAHSPESFEWSRATTYLHQTEHPFDQNVEPAMRWRILPALVAHLLGTVGVPALLIPWIGLVCLSLYVVRHLRLALDQTKFVVGAFLLIASTSAFIVPIDWLGINDAWIWLGLLVVAFDDRPAWTAFAILLTPWVDERFIIGYPLAWTVHQLHRGKSPFSRDAFAWLLLFLPYGLTRVALGGSPWSGHAEQSFLRQQLHTTFLSLSYAPLAWWFGLRVAWAAVIYAVVSFDVRNRLQLAAIMIATALISLALASDMSRSIAILCPLVLLGCIRLAKTRPVEAPRIATWAGVLALVVPAAHIVFTKIAPVDNLLIELARLYRIRH